MSLSIEFQARNQLLERVKEVEKCFRCGVCTLSCPITQYAKGDNLRGAFAYQIFGSDDPSANPNLWSCPACYKCYEVCPLDVNLPRVLEALKEIAFEKGRAPLSVTALVGSVIHTGTAFPVTDTSERMRARWNLPTFAPKDVDDLERIARNTGLKRKLDMLRSKKANEHEQ